MRIDKLLWQLRLTKTRSRAQILVATGHVRRNGTRVLRASQDVVEGDTLTLPLTAGVLVIEVLALPVRRGPAVEAQACYRTLDPNRETAIAPGEPQPPGRGPPQ
jgi:ribosome-associated heat shock protein Hsp15